MDIASTLTGGKEEVAYTRIAGVRPVNDASRSLSRSLDDAATSASLNRYIRASMLVFKAKDH